MSNNYYILDENLNVVEAKDMMEWAKYFESASRRVAETTIGNKWIATVFLGLDRSFRSDKLLVFETMILDTETERWEDYQTRCSTYQEAEKMHLDAVTFVQGEKQSS